VVKLSESSVRKADYSARCRAIVVGESIGNLISMQRYYFRKARLTYQASTRRASCFLEAAAVM
jgi:hypothetical protein